MNYSFSFIIAILFLAINLTAQNDKMLDKLDKNDSIASIKARDLSGKSVVTNEIHNVFFRNIYPTRSNNEEAQFQKEINRLMPFDNKKIDTVIYIQVNAFGENIYDTVIKSNRFETVLSKSIHVNTKQNIIKNRYEILSKNEIFSPYLALENARLIRSSGIFHDVRIEPIISKLDTNIITLIYHLQDVFPYGFSLGINGLRDYSFGIENVNVFGLTHRISTDYRLNFNDPKQVFGVGARYTVPNIIKKSFIDAYVQVREFSNYSNLEIGVYRQFSRPEFQWAGGNILAYNDRIIPIINNQSIKNRQIENQLWLSRAFPFRSRNTTINSIITGLKYTFKYNIERPNVNSQSYFNYWNSHFVLYSLGYSKIRYRQDRLINGFGRTEDIPSGMSINGLYGLDFNEFNLRNYYGGQFLGQYYTGAGYYVNLSTKLGFYSRENEPNQGVFDFNIQQVSQAYKLGNFRLRNYFNLRTTIGIHHDSSSFITLNDYNGIRGASNGNFKGNSRFTTSFQTNLFLPLSLGGFRFSVFSLIEIAKIQPNFSNFFETPLKTGFSLGLAIKNENLIFDVIQIQYGLFPSTSNLQDKGFVISSIIPFRFQNLDISKPNIVNYE